jgi:hypothetical protein
LTGFYIDYGDYIFGSYTLEPPGKGDDEHFPHLILSSCLHNHLRLPHVRRKVGACSLLLLLGGGQHRTYYEMTPDIRLLIGIISARDWKPSFGVAMTRLASHLRVHGIHGETIGLGMSQMMQCSNMCFHRQQIMMQGIEENWSHVVFIDDDVTFPPHSIDALFYHKKPFIGINICKKIQHAVSPTASRQFEAVTSEGKEGLEEVESTTMALFVSSVEEYKKIKPPYFMLSGNHPATDDNFYHSKIREAGHKIYIDHTLSNQCGHIGDYIYTFPGSPYHESLQNPVILRTQGQETQVVQKLQEQTQPAKEEAVQGAG